MEPLVLMLALAAGGLGWWWYRRTRPAPVEDEWVLPPASEAPGLTPLRKPTPASEPRAASTLPPVAGEREVLDRDALLKRDRTFDPSLWDAVDSDSGGEAEVDDLPKHFDRDYLEKLRDRRTPNEGS